MTKLTIQTDSVKKVNVDKKKKVAGSPAVHREYATGKRKTSIARVWLAPGTGKILVNKLTVDDYFPTETCVKSVMQIFASTDTVGQYDIISTIKGGGVSGQVGALRHGIAKALNQFVPELHVSLRKFGFLTRDSRVVERKKYGKHKARKSTQFSKR